MNGLDENLDKVSSNMALPETQEKKSYACVICC